MPATSPRARRSARLGRAALAALIVIVLTGCSARMSGTWATPEGTGCLEFRSNGTVYMTTLGATIACQYAVDEDKVIVKGPNGSQVMTRSGDRLQAGFGMTFVRR